MRKELFGMLLIAAVGFLPTHAQTTLEINASFTGEIGINTTQTYSFTAMDGQVLSFFAEATSTLDPELRLANSAGDIVLVSDDYAYPESLDALMESITIPRTDTYTLTVSGVNGTTGTYRLSMFGGYSTIAFEEDFNRGSWTPSTDTLLAENVDDGLQLTLTQSGHTAVAVPDTGELGDGYLQAQFSDISGTDGWRVGLSFRQQADSSYLYEINQDGAWRFSIRTPGESTVLRDWVVHPAIRPGETAFNLAVLLNESGFSFFYNGQFIGREVDTALNQPGLFGAVVGTPATLAPIVSVHVDDVVVTTPRTVNGVHIQPQRLILESAALDTILALQHQRLIRGGQGEMALTVPESTAEFARPGVSTILLGRGTTYQNFAMSTTVSWQASLPGPAGCGLVLRHTGDDAYTLAYLDATGGYGVSRRTAGDFELGLFGVNETFAQGEHKLLLIADQDQISYYIDGIYLGILSDPARAGEVGTAAVNFEGITTTCRFQDTWLWRWGQ